MTTNVSLRDAPPTTQRLNTAATDTAAAFHAGASQLIPHIDQSGRHEPFIVLTDSDGAQHLQTLPKPIPAPLPTRKEGKITLLDAESFIAEYHRHTDDSRIYAQLDPAQIVAVIDAHRTQTDLDAGARFQAFRLTYQPQFTRAFTAWLERDGKPFEGNVAFGEWIEENACDVVKPSGAEMLQMALSLRVVNNASWKNAVRLSDGNQELEFTNTVDATAASVKGGRCKLPEQFTIKVPIFQALDAKPVELQARLRLRLSGGGIKIWYQLHRPNEAIEQAFRGIIGEIGKRCKVPVLLGRC